MASAICEVAPGAGVLVAARVLQLPPAARHPPSQVAAALGEAESSERAGKPLLDFSPE